MRDAISDFGFFEAMLTEDKTAGALRVGRTLDLQGYDGATIAVTVGSGAGGSGVAWTAQYWQIMLQHGLASAAGVSVWSDVTAANILHSVYGSAGALSIVTSGIWQSILSTDVEKVYVVGYIGNTTHRYLRVALSEVGAPSVTPFAAVAVFTRHHSWPVREVVGR